MSGKRFVIQVDDNRDVHILDNGVDRGLYRICDLLNTLYKENKALKMEIEELEDTMISDQDIVNYLQACHDGDVKNIKSGR